MIIRIKIPQFITAFVLLFIFTQIKVQAQWELSLDRDSIQVYNKPNSDGYSFYKAKGYIHADVNDVFRFLTNIERFPEWVTNCADTKVLEREGEEIVYFALYEMPWPVSDRYSLTHLTINEKSDTLIRLQSNPTTKVEFEYEDGLRITRFNEKVHLTRIKDKLTYVEMYGAYDPGGAIPSWLTDKFLKYGPMDAILTIKERVE